MRFSQYTYYTALSVIEYFRYPTCIPPHQKIMSPLNIEILIFTKISYNHIFSDFKPFFTLNFLRPVKKWLWSFSSNFEENSKFWQYFSYCENFIGDTMLDLYSTSPENFVKICWKLFDILQHMYYGCICHSNLDVKK